MIANWLLILCIWLISTLTIYTSSHTPNLLSVKSVQLSYILIKSHISFIKKVSSMKPYLFRFSNMLVHYSIFLNGFLYSYYLKCLSNYPLNFSVLHSEITPGRLKGSFGILQTELWSTTDKASNSLYYCSRPKCYNYLKWQLSYLKVGGSVLAQTPYKPFLLHPSVSRGHTNTMLINANHPSEQQDKV